MDKQTLLTLVTVTLIGISCGHLAAFAVLIGLIVLSFLLTFLPPEIVGASVPPGLSHTIDELTLFFLSTAATPSSSDTPQRLLEAGSEAKA